ncbi:MAG: imidazole glycerol phosphate synthase subunit HisH [Candidatus Hodarchaeota archaeon]
MPFNIAIIDYEMGNLKSIYKLFRYLEIESVITSDPKKIRDADGIILPGVGAFGDAMKQLNKKNLVKIIKDIINDKKPLFGICLGLHLLFSKSSEMGTHGGLDLIKGEVISFDKTMVNKIPQIGWNNVQIIDDNHFLVKEIPNNAFFYFVHSFYAIPKEKERILGKTNYGEIEYCSIVCKDNIVATQFHPEKSSKYGIKMYQNFIHYCRK